MNSSRLAVIVPTKDRPTELSRLLRSLASQSCPPAQVVVIGEDQTEVGISREWSGLNVDYFAMPGGSTSAKRNLGVKKVRDDIRLIGYMDDDSVLAGDDALRGMVAFWDQAPASVGGAGFNWLNWVSGRTSWIKRVPGASALALYDDRPGVVLRSGFHTVPGKVKETTFFSWLPTGAVVYRREIFEEYAFDEWLTGFSYLDDLDFSYRVGKKYRLAVVPDAGFLHLSSPKGHDDPIKLGEKHVVNLLYFVSKNRELSVGLCLFGLLLRGVRNVLRSIWRWDSLLLKRAAGNWKGLLKVAVRGLRPVET